MFENREFRRIFGLLVEEVRSGGRKRFNKELHNLFYSPNSIWIINSRTKYETHLAHIQGFGTKSGRKETTSMT
jgi:hypothetical protein